MMNEQNRGQTITFIVIGLALLIGVGVITFLVGRLTGGDPSPTPTAVAIEPTETPPAAPRRHHQWHQTTSRTVHH